MTIIPRTLASNESLLDRHLLSQFGTGPKLPVPCQLVHKAFEGVVDAHPDIIAARFGRDSLTYRQLDVAANRLAHHLIDSGLRPRQRVCLVVQRSFEMLIAIFATLKAGCQYVPIDGSVASETAMQHILSDTEARFVLCLPRFWDKLQRMVGRDAIVLPLGIDTGAFYSAERPNIHVASADGAYAIYTSGSTGIPKGVSVSHRNLTNALLLEPANLGIKVGSKVAQVLSVAFDMGAWEILGCLVNGGTLHLRGSDWQATLQEVDTLISTPSILAKYSRAAFPQLRTVVTGGEPCPQALADEWAKGACYYNICGPTEVTILNTAHRHVSGTPLSIGRPLPNTTCYILDDENQLVPLGHKGVMWVGGAGVSCGYINLPKLTSQRYQRDDFANDGSTMFCTGDIVRWREDGSLETFGRMDDQVKIKGFRVELDGITAVVEKFSGITRAATMIVENEVHCFYTAQVPVDEQELDTFVHRHLPYYSVPRHWSYVTAIPMTPNGKVDKTALSEIALSGYRAVSDIDAQIAVNSTATSVPANGHSSEIRDFALVTDPEKGQVIISTDLSVSSRSNSIVEVPDVLPEKLGLHGQRWFRHRIFILYRRFFSVVIIANAAMACFIFYRRVKLRKQLLADMATATAANLAVAVLMRSEPVINVLFTLFCSVPTRFPLAIRRHCARIFHIGGIHSGCALAATLWLTLFTVGASLELSKPLEARYVTLAPTILSYIVVIIIFGMGILSYPEIRARHHDLWEMTHRFGGWTSLLLLWAQTLLSTRDLNPDITPSKAYLQSAPVWLLAVATLAIVYPWLYLRKVAVTSEVLSTHAIRLWFQYTTPTVGTSVRLAQRPLIDWHGFATITNEGPRPDGFSLIVSRAGDFTGSIIERAPTHIWVRGIPTCGVLRIATLFQSVVLVATGSGIGPCLAVILARKIPCRILWTAANPEQTFGKAIVDSVLKTDPKAVIHNTRTQGKPDMSLMTWRLYQESRAEAVCVISNKRVTTKVVYDMECRGIPAYGAIFDS